MLLDKKYSGNNVLINRLKERMEAMNLNPRTLAARSKVGRSFVYDILNGKSKNPTSSKLSAICKELEIPLSYLISEEDKIINYQEYISLKHIFDDEVKPQIILHDMFLKTYCIEKNNDLYFYQMSDDSMENSVSCNDIVILRKENITTSNLVTPGVFIIRDEVNTVVRRLEPVIGDAKIHIIADNKKYNSYFADMKDVYIIAKILFCIKQL